MRLNLIEQFTSFQGEGLYSGARVDFLRLAGCNRRCEWCDTKNSWEGTQDFTSAREILDSMNTDILVVTGGEPLLQLYDLVRELTAVRRASGCRVHLETNGDLLGKLPLRNPFDWVAVAPKSKECLEQMIDRRWDELKLVVGPNAWEADEWFDRQVKRLSKIGPIFLQPEWSIDPAVYAVSQRMIATYFTDFVPSYNVRFGAQRHKLMGWE